jgi:hypothetical protein
MSGEQETWWFSADKRWYRGRPPQGWWLGRDRRWHPPGGQDSLPADDLPVPPPARRDVPAHRQRSSRPAKRPTVARWREWTGWPGAVRHG